MSNMTYNWKISNIPIKAQDAGEHLEKLETQHGSITPKIVLDSARSEDSLLHPCFEWKDEIAAEKYRETQAGKLIRNLTVSIIQHENGEPIHTRALVNVKNDGASEYQSIVKVLRDDGLKNQMLNDALKELRSFKDKYANLSELSNVFAEIEKLSDAA